MTSEIETANVVTASTAAEPTTDANFEAARDRLKAVLAAEQDLRKRMASGLLTLKEYRKLNPEIRAAYRRRFGRPRFAHEIRAQQKKVAKRHAAKKLAAASRRANRA